MFLKLIDNSFPPGHPLKQICNRNTIKLSYRCTPNMNTIIAARNAKLLNAPEPQKRKCNCTKGNACPVEGNCLKENVIYKATVTQVNNTVNTYTGLTCNTFKARLGTHKHSFNNAEANQTTLSNHIRELNQTNTQHTLQWEIVDQAKPFNPVTGICALCTREKFFITFKPPWATLNHRSEMFASCRHKSRMLLENQKL